MNYDQHMIDTLKHEAIFNNLFSFSYGPESKVRVDATLFEIIKMSLPIMHKLIRDTPYGVQKFTAKLFAVTLLGEEYVNNLKENRPLYDEFCHCLEIAYIGLLIAVYDNLESLPNDDWHVILENYPEFGDEENPLSMDINEEEKYKLTLFRYVMKLAQLVIPPKNNKGRLLEIVTRITEGYGSEYKTGSGQTKATARRVVIYEREGGVVPIPKRRKGYATSEDGSNTPADTPRTARSSVNGEYVDTARSGYDRSTDSQSRLTLEAGEHSPDSSSVNNNGSYANSSHASSPTPPHHKLPQPNNNNTATSSTAATQFSAATNGIASPVRYPVEYQYQYQQPLQPMQPPLTAIQLQQQQQQQQFPLQSLQHHQHQQLQLIAPLNQQQQLLHNQQLYTQQQQQPKSPLKIIPVTEVNEDNIEMLIDDSADTAAVTDGAANALLSMAMEMDDFEGSVLGQSRGREGMTRSRRYSHDSANIFSTESQKGYFLSLFTSYGSSRRDLMNHSHSSITAMNTYNNTHTNPNPSSAYNSSGSHNNSNSSSNVMNGGNSTHSMLSAMMEADGHRLNGNNYNNNNHHNHANNNYPSYTTNLNNSGTTTNQIPTTATAGITAGTVNSRDKMCSSQESMTSMISGLSAKDHSPKNSWNKNTFNYYNSSPSQVMQHLQQQQAQQQAQAQLQQQIQSQNNFYQQQQQLQPDTTVSATASQLQQPSQQQQQYTLMSPPKSLSVRASSFLPFYSSNSNNDSSSSKSNNGNGNDNNINTNTSANTPNNNNNTNTTKINNTNNNIGDQNIRNSLTALTKNIFSFAAGSGGSSSSGIGAKSPR